MTISATAASGTRVPLDERAPSGGQTAVELRVARALLLEPPALLAADSTRMPIMPSSAGISVTAAVITMSTTIAAAIATPLRKLTPSTSRPSSATMTVAPANSTARPRRVERAHARRLRVAPGLDRVAVAGDDEQRVVDADAEADQRGQRAARTSRCRSRARAARSRLRPVPSASTAVSSGSSIANSEPNASSEHDRRGDEADQLARPAARLLGGLLDARAAELDLQAVAARVLGGVDQRSRRRTSARRRSAARRPCARWRTRPCRPRRSGAARRGERAVDAVDVRPLGDRVERLVDLRLVAGSVTSSAAKTTWLVSVASVLKLSSSRFRARRRLGPRQRERVRVARIRRWR